jgi:hypothetical protein
MYQKAEKYCEVVVIPSIFNRNSYLPRYGVVHKLRLQILPISNHLPTSVYIG